MHNIYIYLEINNKYMSSGFLPNTMMDPHKVTHIFANSAIGVKNATNLKKEIYLEIVYVIHDL